MAETKQAAGSATPVRDRAIAGWESTAVQTLDPRLTPEQSSGVWKAILALREHKNVDKFEKAASDVLAAASADVQKALAAVVANLREVLQIQG